MNAIVRNHYPIDRLPEDLRQGLPQQGWVNIEITPEDSHQDGPSLADLVGRGRNVHGNEDDVIEHIRALRDVR